MLTLKLIQEQQDSEGDCFSTTLSCEAFDVYESESRITLIVYPKIPSSTGVEYVLGPRGETYSTCFVTNEVGKTIDRYCALRVS